MGCFFVLFLACLFVVIFVLFYFYFLITETFSSTTENNIYCPVYRQESVSYRHESPVDTDVTKWR